MGPFFIRLFSVLYFTVANLGAAAFLFTTRENFQAVGRFDETILRGRRSLFTMALKKLAGFNYFASRLSIRPQLRMHSARHL